MSGFLRRTKRSRAADTGEPSAVGPGAGPEGARTAEISAADASSARTTELPAGAADTDPAGTAIVTTPGVAAGSDAAIAGPVIQADPSTPAGLDPAAAGAHAVTGRRGRLRRRLRYLRRARELMLRDLGGLLYEVHRTGGGDVAAHAATIGAKVERLTGLDAETAALETALGVPRSEAVVFEPGIGGTCEICGELYGSAARFCSNCGSPAGAPAQAPPAERPPVPAMPKPPPPAADGAPQDDSARPNGRAEPGLPADDPLTAKRSSS